MRTVRTKVYKFNELSEQAKQKAIENYRDSQDQWAWQDENKESMEAFAKIFPITVTDWNYGGRGEGVSFRFDADYIEDMKGQRLATYIWNNYKRELFKGKFCGSVNRDTQVNHNRVKSEKLRNGKYFNAYHSAITLETSCVLTGYSMDDDLTQPIYDFLNKPEDITFRELLGNCFDAWIKACNDDIEYQNSDEFITEEIEANEYEFTQDGKPFNK